jgi:hypothetical protein
MPAPTGRVADGEGEELLLLLGRSLRSLQPVLDDRDEGTLDKLIYELRRGVVRASGFSLGPGKEVEGGLSLRFRKDWLELEQAFIDAPELLDIKGGVVDPPPWGLVLLPVHREVPHGMEEVAVREREGVNGISSCRVKEIAVEGWYLEECPGRFVGEERERRPEACPEVLELVVSRSSPGKVPDPGDAVVLPVEFVVGDEPPLLGDHQGEEPVDDPEELLVILKRLHSLLAYIRTECGILRVVEEPVSEPDESPLDAIAEVVADPAALLNSGPVILLKQAGVGIVNSLGKPRGMDEAVEEGEVGEPVSLHDLFQVELDVGLAPDQVGVPEEAEGRPVRDNPPELLAPVEILLDKRVRGKPGDPGLCPPVQRLAEPGDVDRRSLLVHPATVRDEVGCPLDSCRFPLRLKVIPKQRQERDHQAVAGERGPGVIGLQPLKTFLEECPVGASIVPGRRDLVDERPVRFKPEIGGFLSGNISRCLRDLVDDLP